MIYLLNVVGIIYYYKCVHCYFSEVRARHHGHGVAKNRNKRTPANRARLYDSLLQNYNVILRPVKEERDVINVTHSLGLMQILEFDVVKQLLTFTAMEHLVSSSFFAILNWREPPPQIQVRIQPRACEKVASDPGLSGGLRHYLLLTNHEKRNSKFHRIQIRVFHMLHMGIESWGSIAMRNS